MAHRRLLTLAMKKPTNKLSLRTESLRILDAASLELAAGGREVTYEICPSVAICPTLDDCLKPTVKSR